MIEAVLQGILMGLVLSTFCGPIFFMLLDLGINSTVKAVFFLAFSVFICDALIISVLLLVTMTFLPSAENLSVFYWVGGSILIYFGIRHLMKKPLNSDPTATVGTEEIRKIVIKGFAINLFNPNILLFWFGGITLALQTYNNDKNLVLVYFAAGLSTSFLTDFLKGFTAFHLKKFIGPTFIKYLNLASGIIIIGFGLKLMFFHTANAI